MLRGPGVRAGPGQGTEGQAVPGARVQGTSAHALAPQVGFPEVSVVSKGGMESVGVGSGGYCGNV